MPRIVLFSSQPKGQRVSRVRVRQQLTPQRRTRSVTADGRGGTPLGADSGSRERHVTAPLPANIGRLEHTWRARLGLDFFDEQ